MESCIYVYDVHVSTKNENGISSTYLTMLCILSIFDFFNVYSIDSINKFYWIFNKTEQYNYVSFNCNLDFSKNSTFTFFTSK